ncbi:MAG: aminotransferase class I/II-fold pyridoxal phosphate-dependent enzyme [Acidobacteriota bacterium]|nr:aminotransferase class I/II-fold pyridoxal phosphate-dependent enzyme [Acidobacteriota bacterium]
MSRTDGLNRRSFLRNAGFTALAGAVGSSTPLAAAAAAAAGTSLQPSNGKYDFDTVYNRFGTDSTKFDQQIRNYGKDSVQVGMGIADMDFRAAPAITEALQARMTHENWGYLDMGKATPALTNAVAAWNKKRYGVDIDPDTMVLSAGVHPALIAALLTFSPRGSKVLLQTPTYNGFYSDLTFTGTKAEDVPLKVANGKFSMDFDEFERRISLDTHSFILCNPQNPTGNCWSAEDLTRIGEICLKHRVVVLADEIHCDWVTKGHNYTPFASLPNKAIVNNSLTFKAASKSFGLAAHKVAWYYSTNPDLLARVKVNHRADLNTMGIIASQAAVTGGEDWLNQCVEYIDGNHDFVAKFIAANIPSIKYVKPEGTYLAWLDVTAVADKINSKALAAEHNRTKPAGAPSLTPEQMVERYFVKTAKVHMNQGASYGTGGANHMRMNVATSRKLVELALTNLANALKTNQTNLV